MNIFADFQSRIASLLERRMAAGELPRDLDLGRFVVEPPREATHGDLSTNAAMVYAREAKQAGSNPRALAVFPIRRQRVTCGTPRCAASGVAPTCVPK